MTWKEPIPSRLNLQMSQECHWKKEIPLQQKCPLKQGESYTISGIPIGTDYEITEVKPTDGSSLKKVLISNDGTTFIDDTSFNVEKGSVNGTITAKTAENPVVEFQNNNKPTGNIAVTKKWVTTNGTEITDLKQLPTQYLPAAAEKRERYTEACCLASG